MEKLISIYERKGIIFIGANHRTTAGVWLDAGLYESVSVEHAKEKLGHLVSNSLGKSVIDIPHPSNFSRLTNALLLIAGVRSYKSFLNGAKLCTLGISDQINIIPHKNGGYSGDSRGFTEIPNNVLILPIGASESDISWNILKALDSCLGSQI